MYVWSQNETSNIVKCWPSAPSLECGENAIRQNKVNRIRSLYYLWRNIKYVNWGVFLKPISTNMKK